MVTGERTLARKLVLVQPKMVSASRSKPTTRLHLPKSKTLFDLVGGSKCSFAADITATARTSRQDSEGYQRYCPWEEGDEGTWVGEQIVTKKVGSSRVRRRRRRDCESQMSHAAMTRRYLSKKVSYFKRQTETPMLWLHLTLPYCPTAFFAASTVLCAASLAIF